PGLGRELCVLARARLDRLDPVDRRPELFGLRGPGRPLGDEPRELRLGRAPALEDLDECAPRVLELGSPEAVEGVALRGATAQSQLVRLPVDDDEARPDLLENRDRGRATADERPRAARARECPGEHELAVLDEAARVGDELGELRVTVRYEPAPLDRRRLSTGSEHRPVGALAEQQAER